MKRNCRLVSMLAAIAILTMTLLSGCSKHSEDSYSMSSSYYNYSGLVSTEYDSLYEPEPEFNTEEYKDIEENGFKSTLTAPLSTFAADVDTACYSNIRRVINDGMMPQPDMVRIEELLNYFKYDYPQPKAGEPFSVTTELAPCPWNEQTKLLLVGLQAERIPEETLPDSNLVFLLDVSGSMDSPDKLPLVKQAFSLLVEQLDRNDRISVVIYASSDRVLIDGVPGDRKSDILDTINALEAGGSTAGSKGIQTAYAIAEQNFISGGNNRVILATDGDLNVGVSSEGELRRLVEKKRDSGIYLSVLGFGTGNIKDNKMETLADNGNGNYAYIDSVAEARRVLVQEMGGTLFTVAKDVKLQMDFNPAQIKGYRLLGYEDRLLNAEDFNDDSKDGGEIGSGHRVTALYELVDKDSEMEMSAPASEYQEVTDNGSDNLFTLNIRYKQPDSDASDLLTYPTGAEIYSDTLSDNMKLAASVAEVGMLLRDSEFSGTASYGSAISLLEDTDRVMVDDDKKDFLNLLLKLVNVNQAYIDAATDNSYE